MTSNKKLIEDKTIGYNLYRLTFFVALAIVACSALGLLTYAVVSMLA